MSLSFYWQGGEVMALPPRRFEDYFEIIKKIPNQNHKAISHFLQPKMIAHGKKRNRVLAEGFGNSVGISMEFSYLHRMLKSGGVKKYDRDSTHPKELESIEKEGE